MTSATPSLAELAQSSKAWPFEEARKLLKRLGRRLTRLKVIFERVTALRACRISARLEVARTSMVRHALEALNPGVKTRLVCFSDDMDGLRKVPDNLPQPEMLAANLGKPLTAIPDPFGTHESFGHHMNARLRAFLDHFGFRYEFYSSTATYKSGRFDEALLRILANYDKVMDVMLPTLGQERQQTYSPFLPRQSALRQGAAGQSGGTRRAPRHHHLYRGRWLARNRAGDGGALQAAMEARHGHALGGAGRGL